MRRVLGMDGVRIRNQQDFWAGILCIGTGLMFVSYAMGHEVGTAARMGPGYFPLLLGSVMALLGLIISGRALAPSSPETRLARTGWREILLILGAVALFAGTLSSLGLIVSAILLIVVSSLASHEFSWKKTALLTLVLLVLSYLAFVWGLKLQFSLWPTFLNI